MSQDETLRNTPQTNQIRFFVVPYYRKFEFRHSDFVTCVRWSYILLWLSSAPFCSNPPGVAEAPSINAGHDCDQQHTAYHHHHLERVGPHYCLQSTLRAKKHIQNLFKTGVHEHF